MTKDSPGKSVSVPPTARALEAAAKRQQAEAKALRANLLRRKQQQRARPEPGAEARGGDDDSN